MMEPLIDAVKSWKERGVSFITAHNAPGGIYIDVDSEVPYGAPAIGGYLIGRPFLPVSLARVVQILKTIEIPVIGVGGIFSGNDALQYLLCGCSLVQVGTAAYIDGTGVLKKIKQEIVSWMKRKNYSSISEFRGKVLRKIIPSAELKMKERFPYSIPPETPYFPKIDHKKCTICQACCKSCFYHVLHLDHGKIGAERDRCWSCGLCVGVCPEKAITLVDKKTGKIIWKGIGVALPFK
jgi:ferredoxin